MSVSPLDSSIPDVEDPAEIPPDWFYSSALEKVLEYRFIGELAGALWLKGRRDFEFLRAEVDNHGYDLVVETGGIIRHIQLKAQRSGGRRSSITISTRLRVKPSGCVIWLTYDSQSLEFVSLLWFGGEAGEPLPALGEKVAKHTKANSFGAKTLRANHRVIKRSQFEALGSMGQLVERLFGPIQDGRS